MSSYKTKPNGFRPTWIVIHHSFSPDSTQTRNWDDIRRYHTSYRYQGNIITEAEWAHYVAEGKTAGLEKPWTAVGYNMGMENVDGKLMILDGRPIGEVGAHALGFNTNSIGICVVGNYDLDPPSEDRLSALAGLCREFQREYRIPRDNVIGHRETFGKLNKPVLKSCPGAQFNLDEFRKRLIDV